MVGVRGFEHPAAIDHLLTDQRLGAVQSIGQPGVDWQGWQSSTTRMPSCVARCQS